MSDSSSTPTTVFVTDTSSIDALNRGPITTLFPPPASCTATLTLGDSDNGQYLYYGHNANPYVDYSCYPTGSLSDGALVTSKSWDYYFYSPAICPQGYSEATTFESSFPGVNIDTFLAPDPETTVALCCPSGYEYSTDGKGHQCYSTITKGQAIGYVYPQNQGANGYQRGEVTSSTFASDSSVRGDGIPIMYASSDSALLSSASTIMPTSVASTNAATTGAQTGQTSSLPSPTNSNDSDPGESGGLSTGAKAGIGVAIPLIVIAGLALGFFLFRRRKRHTGDQTAELGMDTAPYGGGYSGAYAPYGKPEGQALYAQNGSQPVHEMYSDQEQRPPQELPGATPR